MHLNQNIKNALNYLLILQQQILSPGNGFHLVIDEKKKRALWASLAHKIGSQG